MGLGMNTWSWLLGVETCYAHLDVGIHTKLMQAHKKGRMECRYVAGMWDSCGISKVGVVMCTMDMREGSVSSHETKKDANT